MLYAKGDKVIISPRLSSVPHRSEKMKREVVYNPLKMVDGIYEMDFDHLESIIDDKCKVLILCNPHNPADRLEKGNLGPISRDLHQAQYFGYLR